MPDGTQVGRNGAHGALLTLPNVISFARLCAAPPAVWLILDGDFAWAFAVFLAAGLSDALDGWVARRTGATSAAGAVLDVVADKTLMVAMYVTLAAVRILPIWLAILVVFRDLLIVGGVLTLTLLRHPVAIRPLAISKVNTALQIAVVAVALFLAGFDLHAPLVLAVLTWTVGALTLVSGAAYVWQAVRAR